MSRPPGPDPVPTATCTFCGPTIFEVTFRAFIWAGQKALILCCSTCADHANTALARRETRWSVGCPIATDVKPPPMPEGQETRHRTQARVRSAARRAAGIQLVFGRERKRRGA